MLYRLRMGLVVLNIVGANNYTEIRLQSKSLHETLEGRTPTTAANGQLQAMVMHRSEGVKDMGEEGYCARVVILIKNTTIDISATFGGGIIDIQQGGEALFQRKSDDGATLGVAAWREMQLQ